jgi:hypothetical protein
MVRCGGQLLSMDSGALELFVVEVSWPVMWNESTTHNFPLSFRRGPPCQPGPIHERIVLTINPTRVTPDGGNFNDK